MQNFQVNGKISTQKKRKHKYFVCTYVLQKGKTEKDYCNKARIRHKVFTIQQRTASKESKNEAIFTSCAKQ